MGCYKAVQRTARVPIGLYRSLEFMRRKQLAERICASSGECNQGLLLQSHYAERRVNGVYRDQFAGSRLCGGRKELICLEALHSYHGIIAGCLDLVSLGMSSSENWEDLGVLLNG